jgi:hypothetical protein
MTHTPTKDESSLRDAPSAQGYLPTFRKIAAMRIAGAGPRDKTINVKVAIHTARMMVAAEDEVAEAAKDYARLTMVERFPVNDVAVQQAYERLRAALSRARE